jgi:hypothetical protein
MRNSLFIFKPPNQREDIIDKCRECDKDRDTASTGPNSVYPHHFSSHKKVADHFNYVLGDYFYGNVSENWVIIVR